MHDRTRRQICRLAFLALCIVPTSGILAWTGWRGSRSHQRACAVELSHAIGLDVSCAEVTNPRPGVTLYRDLELADPETAEPLARMRYLETASTGATTSWIASQTELLDSGQLRTLWHLVDRRLRETSAAECTTQLSAGEATLHWSGGSSTLTDVQARISLPSAAGGQRTAELSFRIAGLDMDEPVVVRVTRQRESAEAARANPANSRLKTTIELDTSRGAIPCEMLAVPLGITNHLGTRATFRGSLWAIESADGWDGELVGEFANVDLQSLVSEQFPHRLSGTANITVRKARFRGGRLEEIEGSFAAGPGSVSQSLINAAVDNLHLATRPEDHHDADMLRPYKQISLGFLANAAGLTLQGQCSGSPGNIVRFDDETVLGDAGGKSGPMVALVRMLVPRSEVQVPATRESNWLIDCMPVPRAILPAGQVPQSRLHVDRTSN